LSAPEPLATGLKALACIDEGDGTTEQRFAALLSALPESGAEQRATAMKAPNNCRDMARLTCQFTDNLENAGSDGLTPEEIMALLNQADVWRKPERFELLLQTLDCTTSYAQRPAIDQLRAAVNAASGVSAKDLMALGYKGKTLGEAIHRERLAQITQALNH